MNFYQPSASCFTVMCLRPNCNRCPSRSSQPVMPSVRSRSSLFRLCSSFCSVRSITSLRFVPHDSIQRTWAGSDKRSVTAQPLDSMRLQTQLSSLGNVRCASWLRYFDVKRSYPHLSVACAVCFLTAKRVLESTSLQKCYSTWSICSGWS